MVAEAQKHGSIIPGSGLTLLDKSIIGLVDETISDAKFLVSPQETIDKISLIDREIVHVLGELAKNYSKSSGFLGTGDVAKKAESLGINVDFILGIWLEVMVLGKVDEVENIGIRNQVTFNTGVIKLLGLLKERFRLCKLVGEKIGDVNTFESLSRHSKVFGVNQSVLIKIGNLLEEEFSRQVKLSMN